MEAKIRNPLFQTVMKHLQEKQLSSCSFFLLKMQENSILWKKISLLGLLYESPLTSSVLRLFSRDLDTQKGMGGFLCAGHVLSLLQELGVFFPFFHDDALDTKAWIKLCFSKKRGRKTMDWLWKHIIASGIWEWILVVLGGILFAFLRKKKETWAPIVAYGLAGCCMVAIIVAAVSVSMWTAKFEKPIQATPENVEALVKRWADDFQLSVRRLEIQNTYFSYVVKMPNGNNIIVERPKQFSKYLIVMVEIMYDSPWLKKLSTSELDSLKEELTLEAARTMTAFSLHESPMSLVLNRRIPISSELTEGNFVDAMEELNSTTMALQIITTRALRRNGIEVPSK